MQKFNLIAQSVLELSHREKVHDDDDDDNNDDDDKTTLPILRDDSSSLRYSSSKNITLLSTYIFISEAWDKSTFKRLEIKKGWAWLYFPLSFFVSFYGDLLQQNVIDTGIIIFIAVSYSKPVLIFCAL